MSELYKLNVLNLTITIGSHLNGLMYVFVSMISVLLPLIYSLKLLATPAFITVPSNYIREY
jgi:hypothetical protein